MTSKAPWSASRCNQSSFAVPPSDFRAPSSRPHSQRSDGRVTTVQAVRSWRSSLGAGQGSAEYSLATCAKWGRTAVFGFECKAKCQNKSVKLGSLIPRYFWGPVWEVFAVRSALARGPECAQGHPAAYLLISSEQNSSSRVISLEFYMKVILTDLDEMWAARASHNPLECRNASLFR